jgi:hypothetical protein
MTVRARNIFLCLIPALMLSFPTLTGNAFCQETAATPSTLPRYKDAALPTSDRVADLLARMTLEEKVDQLS